MNDNGIAWMIAGGVRAESDEDRRQRVQRLELARSTPGRDDNRLSLRERIAAIVGPSDRRPSGSLSADCCPA
jgi:hypothetical protein